MKDLIDKNPLTSIIAIIVVLTGAVICITHPETLDFESFLTKVGIFLGGLGILGVGRSLGGKG